METGIFGFGIDLETPTQYILIIYSKELKTRLELLRFVRDQLHLVPQHKGVRNVIMLSAIYSFQITDIVVHNAGMDFAEFLSYRNESIANIKSKCTRACRLMDLVDDCNIMRYTEDA